MTMGLCSGVSVRPCTVARSCQSAQRASGVGASLRRNFASMQISTTGQRQQRSLPMRLQPLAAAPQKIPDAILDRDNQPAGVAYLRFQRGSPHKVRRVLDQIRGRSYADALALLEYMPFKACDAVQALTISAASNASNNLSLRKAKLYVSEAYADGGPILKRIRPRAKGRAAQILKPMYHLTIKLAERDAKTKGEKRDDKFQERLKLQKAKGEKKAAKKN